MRKKLKTREVRMRPQGHTAAEWLGAQEPGLCLREEDEATRGLSNRFIRVRPPTPEKPPLKSSQKVQQLDSRLQGHKEMG